LHRAVEVDAGKFDFSICTFKIEQFPAVLWGAAEYVDAVSAWVNEYVFLQAGQLAVKGKLAASVVGFGAGIALPQLGLARV